MDKRECEKCHKVMATVMVNKSGSSVDWWYCEPCYGDIIGEVEVGNVRRSRQGWSTVSAKPIGWIP